MARVDFYLIAAAGKPSRQVFACRLAEKAYRLKNTVHIQAADREDARQLDELLWTFRDGSFVPHEVVDEERDGGDIAVTIGIGAAGARQVDLLINLSNDVPPQLDSFPRVAEIVTSDEDCRQQGRRRFADYRLQGHTLQTHEL